MAVNVPQEPVIAFCQNLYMEHELIVRPQDYFINIISGFWYADLVTQNGLAPVPNRKKFWEKGSPPWQ